jgi:hypothetical protein
MATQLLRKDTKSKQNWLRMLKAADKLEFEDGRLVAGKGWKIDDMDVDSISNKLKSMDIDHEIKDRYTIIIH